MVMKFLKSEMREEILRERKEPQGLNPAATIEASPSAS